jgi:hypothetical protein
MTDKFILDAAEVGNLQYEFFNKYGRFPTNEELKRAFRTIEDSRKRRNYDKFKGVDKEDNNDPTNISDTTSI